MSKARLARRALTVARSAAGLALAALGAACGPDAAPPAVVVPTGTPNLVLIVVDTLRADHLSLYGYPRQTTPNLDRLAADGAVFDRAFSVISHTLPAHVSLLTGIHPTGHGVLSNAWQYEGPFPTLAERLREAGYDTAGFVSGLPLDAATGIARGFDRYRDTRDQRGRRRPKVLGTRVTGEAIAWLDDAREPFFLFLHYFDVHPPYRRAPGAAFPFEVDATLRALMQARGVAGATLDEVSHFPLTLDRIELTLAEAINTYDNEIHHVDAMIQQVLDALAARGALANSLLVVTSDHGEGLGQHGYYQHGFHLYEEQLRVPLIVRDFRDPSPRRRFDAPVSLLDVPATLLEAAGLAPAEPAHGDSLLPWLRGTAGASEGERWVLAQRRVFDEAQLPQHGPFASREPRFALRGSGPLKLVWSPGGPAELYDLAADPGETENLAAARPEERAQLLERMGELRQRYATDAPAADRSVEPELAEQLEALGYVP
jgi:arylsulfatase A-like enzyme